MADEAVTVKCSFAVEQSVNGCFTSRYACGSTAAQPGRYFAEQIELLNRLETAVPLTSDAPTAVPFGALSGAHVIVLQSDAKVRARLTSADGSQQSIPVDGSLVLVTKTVPVTAIDLTRVAGIDTTVSIFLGQMA